MRALVTGAGGFVGSHLVEHLVGRGDAVAILRRPGCDPARIGHLPRAVESIEADPARIDSARGAIAAFAAEAVFHAAWAGVSARDRDLPAQLDENLGATLGLLRLAAECGCRVFVGLGSQAEYGPHEGPIDEETPPAPASWYGVAKTCTYLAARRLASDLGVRLAWVRLFSVYGPGDHEGALIPSLIRALLAGDRPALTGGLQCWDYLYVADAAEALRRVAESLEGVGTFNLGSGEACRIRDVAARIRDLIDPSLPLGLGELGGWPGATMHLQADIGRLRRATGWAPLTTLDDGLRRTIAWHRDAGRSPGGNTAA